MGFLHASSFPEGLLIENMKLYTELQLAQGCSTARRAVPERQP